MRSFLHFLPRSIFSTKLIDFFNRHFDNREHDFVIYGEEIPMCLDRDLCCIPNVLLLKNHKMMVYAKLLRDKKYDKVYLHGLFNYRLLLIMLFLRYVLKKTTWVIWGAELTVRSVAGLKGLKHKIYFNLIKLVVKRIHEVSACIKGDYLLAQTLWGATGEYTKLLYPLPTKREHLDAAAAKWKSNSCRIQVSHSASPSNNHIESLNIISRFVNEKIEIICPLGYGDHLYSKEVKKIGEKLFGNEKFFIIQKFLSPKEYAEQLASIDIAIFGANRQEGLGNIFALLYLGKKVFIKRQTSSWKFLTDELGVKIYDLDTIHNMSYSDFVENKSGAENKNKIQHLFDENYVANLWKASFAKNRHK